VSEVLFYISLSIIPYMFRDSITRIYYSFQDSKTPFYIALGSILLKLVFNSFLVKSMGINGIALSTTIITLINGTLLAFLIRDKISLGYRKFVSQIIKILICAIISYFIGFGLNVYLNKILPELFVLKLLKVLIVFVVLAFVYVICAYLFKVEYLKDLKEKIEAKFAKR